MKLNILISVSTVLVLLPGTAAAQDFPSEPAAQLAALEGLIGTWEGSGTSTDGPDGQKMPWTSKHSVSKALGGHFVREVMRIDIGPNMTPIVFVSYTGWDRENQRYVSISASNMGTVDKSELSIDGGTMVSVSETIENGKLTVDHWVTWLDGDEMRYVDHRIVGDGKPFVHVEGTSKRISAEPTEIEIPTEPFAFAQIDRSKTEPMAAMTGTYELQGWMIPQPGAPKMDIRGSEKVLTKWGGSVMAWKSTGDAGEGMPPYQGVGFMAWRPADERYVSVYASNFGEIGTSEGWLLDGDFVMIDAGLMYGAPTAHRTVLTLDDDGRMTGIHAETIAGTHEPARTFEATYERTGDAGDAVEAAAEKKSGSGY